MGKLSLRGAFAIWIMVTAAGCLAYVFHVRTLPPDDLVMANTVGFQILASLFVVGLPSLAGMAVFLICYPVVRDWLARRQAR